MQVRRGDVAALDKAGAGARSTRLWLARNCRMPTQLLNSTNSSPASMRGSLSWRYGTSLMSIASANASWWTITLPSSSTCTWRPSHFNSEGAFAQEPQVNAARNDWMSNVDFQVGNAPSTWNAMTASNAAWES